MSTSSSAVLDRALPPGPGATRPFRFPQVHRRVLPNGLNVLVAQLRNFPVATLDVICFAGGLADPPEKAGVAALTSALLESGAGGRSAAQVAEAVDALGIQLEAGVSWDTMQVGFTGVRARLEAGAALLADLVRHPAFPEHEVERLRDERLAALRQRRATPSVVPDEVANLYAYAPGAEFGRPLGGLAATAASLTRADVAAFHAARYLPGGSTVAIAGDVGVDEAVELVERHFGGWAGQAPPPPVADTTPRLDRTSIVVVHHPGAVQAELRVAHVGIARSSPDLYATTVMNGILGGNFTSRINLNLRERLGYTYGASSSFATRRQAGPFSVSAAVQTEGAAYSASEVLRDMREMRESEVTPTELADARSYLAGIFPLGLQTTDGLATRLTNIATYDLPDDHYQQYRERLLAVTAEEVHQAAREHLWPDRAAVVVGGDADQLRAPLEALGLGPVEVVDPAELG